MKKIGNKTTIIKLMANNGCNNFLFIMKKVENKTKSILEGGFGLNQVSSGADGRGVSKRFSSNVYGDSQMVTLEFQDSLLFNFVGFNFLIY